MKTEGDAIWSWVQLSDGSRRRMTSEEVANHSLLLSSSRVYRLVSLLPAQYRRNQDFVFEFEGKQHHPPRDSCWKTDLEGMTALARSGRLQASETSLQQVLFQDDYPTSRLTALWDDTGGSVDKMYVVQTSPTIVQRCILASTDPGDLVLDSTCGSGTTAYVAEQWGRRWITIDTSRVALALARTRLMGAKYPYFLLADSPEGVKKEAEVAGKIPPEYKTDGDIRKGFVYKRVPHVTLKSIANNPDIKEGMTRAEIDAAISRHADTEMLVDKPYEDNKRIRVSGPFTVASLSPHRVLATDEERPAAEREGQHDTAVQFEQLILDNLRKAGVQNTVKNERLVFTRLEPHPGQWIQAAGEYH